MKKLIILLALINILGTKAQTVNCDKFCILNIEMDTVNNNYMNVTVYNGDTNFVNYPVIDVVDSDGDTIGDGTINVFGQLAGDTFTYNILTTLTSIPTNFTTTVLFSYAGDTSRITCTFNYPMDCASGTGISDSKTNQKMRWSLFPNPATNSVNIDLRELADKQAILTIYDNTGRMVKTMVTKNNLLSINLEGLSKGIYCVTINTKEKYFTKKLMIE